MSNHVDSNLFDANRGRVQAALILCEDYLSESEVTFLQEYIDHDEFGLALDEIVSLLLTRKTILPISLVAELESMASIMYPGESREERLAILRRLAESESP